MPCAVHTPPTVGVLEYENHHVGEGLYQLSELIRILGGKMWIASGNGEIIYNASEMLVRPSAFNWPGVAIEFQIVVSRGQSLEPEQDAELEQLAERLGI